MFGIGSTELVIILIVALVLIGPSKLPDLMKSLGKGISEFRRMSTDVKSTLEREIEKADEAKRIEETKKELFGDGADKAQAEAKPEEKAAQPDGEKPQAPAAEAKAQASAPQEGKAEAKAQEPAAPEGAAKAQAEALQDGKAEPKDKSHA